MQRHSLGMPAPYCTVSRDALLTGAGTAGLHRCRPCSTLSRVVRPQLIVERIMQRHSHPRPMPFCTS